MAKLDRKDVKIFAENSKETLITEFRTEDSQGNTASFSRDPDVIQNENYSQGWVNDTNDLNTKIYGEDLNAVNYVLSYLLKYLYENGIADWKSTTTYYLNSICKVDNALYLSLQNNNIGNDPTSTVSYWKLIPLENVSIEDAGSGFSIVKDVTDNVITFKTISVTGYGEITDNGDQLNIDIAGGGGGGGGDTYWGMIRGTITNQTDLMALINLKQDIFTVDSPLVLTDEQHLTINKATSSVSGYLDYNDFNTFNGKQDTISATLPISITNNNIEIATADTSTTGVLSYTDWNTFNGKQDTISATAPLSLSSNTLSIAKATSTVSGYLESTDWATFNNKYNSANTGINMYHTTDTATIRPVVESGYTNSYIGTSSYPFTNGYINEVNSTTVKVGTLSPTTGNTNINISGDLIPNSTSEDLGSSSSKFGKMYCEESYLNTINGTNPNTPIIGLKIGTRFYLYDGTNAKLEFGFGSLRPLASGYNIGNSDDYFGTIYAQSFTQRPSDIREKENVENYKNSVLSKLDKLNPITYTIKGRKDGEVKFGLSAQELQEIEPLCVVGSETKSDEKLGIDLYATLTLAMQAIKELNAKVEALEARVNELEGNKKELEK